MHIPGTSDLLIQKNLVEQLEKATGMDREALLFYVGVTILHEFAHYGEGQDGKYTSDPEIGELFEIDAYGDVIGNIQDARNHINRWLERQNEIEMQNKSQQLSNLLSNFDNLAEGTYTWNGSSWERSN